MVKKISVPTKIFQNPKYRGKHVAISGNKVIAYGNWENVSKVFDQTIKKSKKVPTLTYIPKEGTLILYHQKCKKL